jgi:hypothetical protein
MRQFLEECPHHPIGSTASGVAIEWDHAFEPESLESALIVFTEVATGNQTRYEVKPNFHPCISLTTGLHRVAVFAEGFETYRTLLELQPGYTTPFRPVLNPSTQEPRTLKEALSRFELHQRIKTRDLEVSENTTVVLDTRNDHYKSDWRSIEIRDVESAKRIFGHSDDLWGGNVPRFTPLSLSTQTNPEEVARHAVREYVYGSSASVKQWTKLINETLFSEATLVPLFFFETVTINAGGVLVIGDNSNIFICGLLRMHVTSTLLIRGSGPMHVEPIALKTFC